MSITLLLSIQHTPTPPCPLRGGPLLACGAESAAGSTLEARFRAFSGLDTLFGRRRAAASDLVGGGDRWRGCCRCCWWWWYCMGTAQDTNPSPGAAAGTALQLLAHCQRQRPAWILVLTIMITHLAHNSPGLESCVPVSCTTPSIHVFCLVC